MRSYFFTPPRFVFFILALSLGVSHPSSAAVPSEPETTEARPDPSSDSMTWLEHIGRDFATPVLNPGRVYFITGSVLTLCTLPLRKPALAAGRDQPLKSSSTYGQKLGLWSINMAYLAGFLTYGLIADDSVALQRSLLMLRATVYTGIVTTGIKALRIEERPKKNGDYLSFPSGHTSNAFAFAGVVLRNHGPLYGVPALAMATFVGFSRMNDNFHYLNDILFGATLGLSYSLGLDASWSSKDQSRTATIVPLIDSQSAGIGALFEF